VTDPECVECPNVPYPEMAKSARLEGVVEVSFIVAETGGVQDIRIEESGGEVFDRAVVDVLKGWRYQPATKQGIPVKVRMHRRFRFRRGR
jgi:TonB family protein